MQYRQNNFSYAIDSSFNPLSMQEMLQPFVAYKDAYEKTEEAYYDLSDKADKFKYLSKTLPEGSEARQIYEGYAKDLTQQAESLAKHGLSMNNRRALTDLKRRYKGEIGRLDEADTRRRAQIEEQRKLILQDPTRMFSREAAMTTLDDYLNNPELNYKNYSGALLAQQVGQAASNIAKSLRNYGKGEALDGYTKTWLQEHGYTPEQVAQAIADPMSDKTGVLSSIVEQAVQSSGIPKWADDSTLKQAYDYARQGLWNAVGQTTAQTYTDQGALLEAKVAAQRKLATELQDRQQQINRPQIIPRALRSQQEIDDNTKKINSFVKDGYMKEVDDKYVLTEKGKKEYMKIISRHGVTYDSNAQEGAQGKQTTWTEYTPFRKYMDSLNGGKAIVNDKRQIMPTVMGNLFTNAVRRNSSEVYDIYHSTEYVRQLPTGAYQDAFKQQVMAEPEVLVKRDFNGRDGWKEEKIEKEDLKDYKPARFNYSKYGNTITWVNDKGESIRTNAPKGVNEQVSDEVMKAFDYENIYSQILHTGKLPKTVWDYSQKKEKIATDKNGKVQFTDTPLTQRQMQAYTNDWYNVMDAIQGIGAMYISPSTTKTREYGSYDFGSGVSNISDLISDSDEE